LYADTDINECIEILNLITNQPITKEEEKIYRFDFDYKSRKDETKLENRRKFITENLEYFREKCEKEGWKPRPDETLILCLLYLSYQSFSKFFIEKRGFIYIRSRTNNDVVAKIPLEECLWFLNYVSFSYDNKYVAIAGRYPNESDMGGLFLVYDLEKHKCVVKSVNSWAVWLTAFNKHNMVASYSSEPISYDAQLSNVEDNEVKVNIHHGFSFLTFSPDGEYAALSTQGYVSKYDKNNKERSEWGHQPSCKVFIVKSAQMNPILGIYSDLSNSGIEGISDDKHNFYKSVSSVSFSNDNKRLMMVGNDGVVIIRNLHLD
jgi:WD40 repeat protein